MSGSPLDSFSLITSTTPLEQIFRTTTVCLDESSPEVRDLHKVIPEGAEISIYVLDTECSEERKYQESHVVARN